MSYQGFWQNDWRWQYLVRWDGVVLWETTTLEERLCDWPNPGSEQCCDCVVSAQTGRFAAQFKSFPPYLGPVQDGAGDGGDVLVITDDGYVKIIATQDGGHPGQLYYFVGPGVGQPGDARVGGWLIAGPDLAFGWNSRVTWLDQSFNGPYNPVGNLTPAYTRYILAPARVPYAVNGVSGGGSERSVIVSEHYTGADPTQSPIMERFIYAQWMGLVRWEFYGTGQAVPGTFERAIDFPYGYPTSAPLNPSLRLNDCRTWTNWRSDLPRVTTRAAGWPSGVVLP